MPKVLLEDFDCISFDETNAKPIGAEVAKEFKSTKNQPFLQLNKTDKNLKKETAQIISQNVLLLTDMAALAQDNTNALDFITGTARRQSTRLAERLKADGWYAPDANLTQDTAKRKDAALALNCRKQPGSFKSVQRKV